MTRFMRLYGAVLLLLGSTFVVYGSIVADPAIGARTRHMFELIGIGAVVAAALLFEAARRRR